MCSGIDPIYYPQDKTTIIFVPIEPDTRSGIFAGGTGCGGCGIYGQCLVVYGKSGHSCGVEILPLLLLARIDIVGGAACKQQSGEGQQG